MGALSYPIKFSFKATPQKYKILQANLSMRLTDMTKYDHRVNKFVDIKVSKTLTRVDASF